MRSVFSLMTEGGTVDAPLDLGVSFPDVATRAGAVWSLLYLAGYLTTDDVAQPNNAGRVRPLRVPNREISEVYRNDIVGRFTGLAGSTRLLSDLHRALVDGDAGLLAEELEGILLNSASCYDLTSENSYHMLLVGLLFGAPGYGNPVSNREAGRGRFDIRLLPRTGGAARDHSGAEVRARRRRGAPGDAGRRGPGPDRGASLRRGGGGKRRGQPALRHRLLRQIPGRRRPAQVIVGCDLEG